MMTRRGFTLIEMLLVLVIVTVLLVMGINYMQQKTTAMRIDRTALQMQQILNAGLAYYVSHGAWPPGIDSLACLQGNASAGSKCGIAYLPSPLPSPWNEAYEVYPDPNSDGSRLAVSIPIYTGNGTTARLNAQIIASRLPMGFITQDRSYGSTGDITPCSGTLPYCVAVGNVSIPGQDLNNASAVNFAGVYNHGGCVPVPTCPIDISGGAQMIPQIMVAPASVSGFGTGAAAGTGTSTDAFTGITPNVYPISSFTGYATGPESNPPQCDATTAAYGEACPGGGDFWRVCLQIVTEKGTANLTLTGGSTGQALATGVTLMAFTRCAIKDEPSGSTYEVFK
ncbi:MAG: hypothetical protein A3F11_08595 [Gammaproteobacteria bacterium RIFCSPHIGHO2_12_FULL_37_14]|nr:MAG: hypothetical protein A3F11_08595 [Gammaproteobacteria bacterium RIFCSPHIGHO2_12_FULL_37_14]